MMSYFVPLTIELHCWNKFSCSLINSSCMCIVDYHSFVGIGIPHLGDKGM